MIPVLIVVACLLCCVLILIVIWKVTKFGRLLQPKLRKKEVELHDLIVPAGDSARQDEDLNLNPVLQAKMIIEEGDHADKKSNFRPGAAGALQRLLRGLGNSFFQEHDKKKAKEKEKRDQIRKLDRELKKETEKVQAVERRIVQDIKVFKEAEAAAKEAKKKGGYR